MEEDLESLVRRFLDYLDQVEISDSGKEFHPVVVSCFRAAWTQDISNILQQMKARVNNEN